ncbi:MAG TPA: hypothetical protein VGE26_06280 [Sphingobacteriaceae bacterium]
MKRVLLTVAASVLILSAFGQYKNFSRISIGAGVGMTQSYTDVKQPGMAQSVRINADYYFTPFLTAGMEGQFGKLHGGDVLTDPHKREFTNSYMAVTANGKVHLGQFINYSLSPILSNIKGLYIGTGLGIINNSMSDIVRTAPGSDYVFPGMDKSMNIVLPFNAGLEYGLDDYWGKTRFLVTAGFQFNFTFGEGIDGYNDPPAKFKNTMPDVYTFTTIGIKYCLGPEGLFSR